MAAAVSSAKRRALDADEQDVEDAPLSRLEELLDVQKAICILIKARFKESGDMTAEELREQLQRVNKYVIVVQNGVALAEEIKSVFTGFLKEVEKSPPKSYEPLIREADRRAQQLSEHISLQQGLFNEVHAIVNAITLPRARSVKAKFKASFLGALTAELDVMQILCKLYDSLCIGDGVCCVCLCKLFCTKYCFVTISSEIWILFGR